MRRYFTDSIYKLFRAFLLVIVSVFGALRVNAQISVTATAGTLGPTAYTTLNAAINAIDAGTHQGVINISVTASTTEPAQSTLNQSGSGAAIYTSVIIKPAPATTPTISGNITGDMLQILGSNVVVDGSNTVGGTTQDLTITNTNATNTSDFIIDIISPTAVLGATNDTIKNCILTNGSALNTYGIVAVGDGVTAGALNFAIAPNSNTTIQNNQMTGAEFGIIYAGDPTGLDQNILITENTISNVGARGINIDNTQNSNVTYNIINTINTNFGAAAAFQLWGIDIDQAETNLSVAYNQVYSINNPVSIGAWGLFLDANAGSSVNIYNNYIADISGRGSTAAGATAPFYDNGIGIFVNTGDGYNIYFNSINLLTNQTTAAGLPSDIYVPTGIAAGAINLVDNILANNETGGSTERYAIHCESAANVFNSMNYNDYYTQAANVGDLGGVNLANLAAIVTSFGGNANSISMDPTFVTGTDLDLVNVPANALLNAGTFIGGITNDIRNTTRVTPTIGAFELVCSLPAISGITTLCPGTTITLSNATTGGTWSSATTSVATVTPGPAGGGVVSGVAAAGGTSVITYSSGGCSTTTTVIVNSRPPAITGTTTLCAAGANTQLSNSVAGTWTSATTSVATITPGGGLVTSVGSGTSVITFTSSSTGCTNTVLVTVTAIPGAISGLTAVCSGSAITLSNSIAGGTWTSSNTNVATVTTGPSPATTVSGTGATGGTSLITYSNGCGSPTITVTVTAVPGAISGNTTICSGGFTTTLSDAALGGTWSSGTVAVASVGSLTGLVTSGVLVAGTSGTSVITYSTGCGAARTTNVTVIAPPGTITGNTNICSGTSTTLSDATNGTWSSSNTNAATITSPAGVVSGTVVGGTTVITYANSCGSAIITVSVTPAPGVISGNNTVCSGGNTTTLSDAVAGGTWSSGSTAVASVGSLTGLVTSGTGGSAVITYSNGCGVPQTITITVQTQPTTISGATALCVGGPTTLSNNGSPTGTWSSSNTFIATIDPVTGGVSPVSTGTVTITAANACGSSTTTLTVTVPPAITGNTTFCENSSTVLSDALAGGTWSSGNPGVATASGGASGVIFGSGIAVGTAPITYSLPSGCSVTTTVTTQAAPGGITGFFKICQGTTTTLVDSTAGGVWTSSNTTVATIISTGPSTGEVFGANPGTTTINYTAGSCSSTAATLFTVDPIPLAITGPSSVCAGSAITLSDATPGGTWTSNNSTVATVGSTTGIVSGAPPGPGTSVISYSLNNGCSATTTVSVNPVPAAITGNTAVCAGLTTNLSDITGGGVWTSVNPAVATIGSSSGIVTAITGSPGGTSVIFYTLPTSCFATTVVTVNPLPSAIIGTTTICAGTTTSLTDAIGGGTWSSSLTLVATVGSASGIVTGGANPGGTTVIDYTLPTGCFTTTSVIINPTPAAITGNIIVCAGLTTNLSDVTGGGVWTSGNTTVATIGTGSGVVTGVPGTTGGTSVISYTLPTSCFTTTVVTVNPSPATIAGPSAVCVGSAITLSDATTGGTWSSNNTNTTVGSVSGTVTGNTPGSSTITYTLPTGCVNTIFITVNPLPTTIAGNTNICAGLTSTLSDGSPGGTWSSSNTSVATIGSLSGIVTAAAVTVTGTTVISYSLGTGCNMTTTVTVNPLPGGISGVTTICAGLTTTLSDATTGGTWSSSVPSTATIGSTTGLVTGGSVLSQLHSGITYTLPTGCTTATTVTVNPLPATIAGNTNVCVGLTTILSDAVAGGTWSSSNPGIASIGSSSGLVTAAAQGTTVITYTLGTGCIMTTTVTVNPLPGSISGITTVCSGLTTTLSDATPGGTWSSATVTVATIGSTTGIVTGAVVTVQHTSLITYTLPTTCIATTTVTVNPLPAVIDGVDSVCEGATISLSDATSGGVWTSSNTTIATIIPAAGTGYLTGGTLSGLDTVTYTLGTGCLMTKTVSVNVQPALIIGGPLSICNGASASLSDVTPGGAWSSGNTLVATVDPTGTVTGTGVGTTHITYGMHGCTSIALVLVNTQPGPITGNTVLCNGGSTTLHDPALGGTWSSSNTLVATINISSGAVSATGVGTSVITYTLGSCIATTTLTVNVQPGPIAGLTAMCNLSTTTMSDPVPGGVWSVANTNAVIGSATGIVTGQNVGTEVVSYTIGSCTSARVLTINVQPSPVTGTTSICDGSSTQLSDPTSGGVWSGGTSSVSIATVSGTGLVTGTSPGQAIITYTIGSCLAETTVTVNPLPSAITGIFYVCQGSSTTLSDAATGGTWSSSNSSIANVTEFTGIVSGNGLGTANIIYALPTGCTTTQTVSVIPAVTPISGNSAVCMGFSSQFSDAIVGGIWTSGNTTIAGISSGSGLSTGISAGTVIITYSLGTGCNAVTPLIVNPLSPIIGSAPVCIGQTINLSDTTVSGTWSSSNSSLATVNQVTGVVTGVTAGTVNISYNLPTGCTATTSVTVLPLPAPITGIMTVCVGSITSLSDASTGGSWSSGNTFIATVDPVTGNVTGVQAGTATISYTQGGCPQVTTVLVNPLPDPIAGNANICYGVTQTFSDATPGGTWNSSNTTIATVDPLLGVVTGAAVGTVTILYTIGTGCAASILVTVNPQALPITGITSVCVGSTTALSDGSPGGAWFSSNPPVATVVFLSGLVTGVDSGTSVITYRIITGCDVTTTVTVNPLPTAISGASGICVGSAEVLSSGPAPGVWSSTNSAVATIDPLSGTVTGVSGGTTVISYTISTGCAATMTLTVSPLPAPISGNTNLCVGMTTFLSDATPGGTWASGSPSIATVDMFTGEVFAVSPVGSVPIIYTLPTGCFITTIVTIVPPPTAISGPTQVCVGSTITLLDGVSGGTWTSINTAAATIDPVSGVLTGVSAGFTIVTYTMGGGTCYVTEVITVNPLPAPITGIMSVCAGLTIGLSDATPGGVWTNSPASTATIGLLTGVLTGINAGTTAVTYTLPVTGCVSTATVTVNPLPAPISGNTNICLGGTRTLSDSPTPGTWSSSNASVTTVGLSTGVVYGNSVGVDTVTYTISATGCIMTTTVAVHPLPAVYTVTGGGNYCSGTGGVHIGLSGSQVGVEYLLYLGSTPAGTYMGTGAALDFGLLTIAGTYTVVAVNTFTTCSNSMSGSAVITVIPTPVPSVGISMGGSGDTVCAGTTVTYTAVPVNGGSAPTYLWRVNGLSVTTSVSYSYIPANGDEVVVTMTSNMLCASPVTVSDTVRMTVLVPETPSVGLLISPADTVCVGTAVTLTAVPSYGGPSPVYLWTVDGLGAGTHAPVYSYVPTNGDIVYCRMVSDYRCRLTDTVSSAHEVITVDTPVIPGVSIAGSPGWYIGDGTSDTLRAIVTNGGSSPTYQWFVNGVPVAGATTSVFVSNNFSFPNEDSVSCQVTGSGYCHESGFNWLYIVVNPTGVHQVMSAVADLTVVPNPNNGVFTLKGTLGTTADEVVSIELTDVLGQVVYKQDVQTRGGRIEEQISVSGALANGMYMLNVRSASVNKVFHVVIEQ